MLADKEQKQTKYWRRGRDCCSKSLKSCWGCAKEKMPYGGTDLQITARQKSFLIALRGEEEEKEEEESVAFTARENAHITALRINHKARVSPLTQWNSFNIWRGLQTYKPSLVSKVWCQYFTGWKCYRLAFRVQSSLTYKKNNICWRIY